MIRSASGYMHLSTEIFVTGKRILGDVSDNTLYDQRCMCSSNVAKLGVPILVTKKLPNHISGTISVVAVVHNRHTYMEKMREAVTGF